MRGSLGPGELGRRGLQQTAYPVDSDTGGMRGLFTEVWAGAGAGQVEGCPPGEMGARSDAAGEAWGAGLVQSLRPCACCWEHTGQGPRVLVRSVRPHRRGLPVHLIFRHPLGSRGFWEHLCRTQVKRSAHFKSLLRTPLPSSPGPSCRPVDHPAPTGGHTSKTRQSRSRRSLGPLRRWLCRGPPGPPSWAVRRGASCTLTPYAARPILLCSPIQGSPREAYPHSEGVRQTLEAPAPGGARSHPRPQSETGVRGAGLTLHLCGWRISGVPGRLRVTSQPLVSSPGASSLARSCLWPPRP